MFLSSLDNSKLKKKRKKKKELKSDPTLRKETMGKSGPLSPGAVGEEGWPS